MKIYDFHSHLGKTRSGEENSASQLVSDLSSFGISKVGICSMSQYSMQENNNIIAKAMEEYPDFIIGMAFIDPKSPDALDEVNRCLGDLKMKGVKFMPWKHGYNAENCPQIGRVLDEIGKYDVHVQIHGGASPLCTPYVWVDYAERIQGVENFWVETSANMEIDILRKAAKILGPERMIFGSDWPYKPTNIEIEKLFHLGFGESELEKVFYKNAEMIWGINER